MKGEKKMARGSPKATGNVYYEARMEAAKWNEKLLTRAGAAELLNVSDDTVKNVELGLHKCLPVDLVVLMADLYMYLLNPEKFSGSMVGTALTVKCPSGDNLIFHQALELAQPGDIIVVDADGISNRSVAGEIMMRFACKKGIAGIVVDGYMRDLDGIKELPMPVYARGVTPQGPYKNGPGEVNVPIACGGPYSPAM